MRKLQRKWGITSAGKCDMIKGANYDVKATFKMIYNIFKTRIESVRRVDLDRIVRETCRHARLLCETITVGTSNSNTKDVIPAFNPRDSKVLF